mgnify:CR=1 FL=1
MGERAWRVWDSIRMAWPRTLLHVDMDQFFAAIAVRDDPALRGKPILVGGAGPRGVVSTASYEARVFGCRSAMPMATARRLCPQAEVVHVPGERIRAASHHLFAILDDFSPRVQPLSVDEAFVDLTGADRLLGDGPTVARRIKDRIRAELRLTGSVGVAPNKFLAKLASDLDKPDGLTVVAPGDVDAVLLPLAVERLWGVGPAMAEKLRRAGIKTVADLRRFGEKRLAARFGELGAHLHRLAFGLDDRPVVPDRVAKSIGQEQTFDQNLDDPEQVQAVLLGQVEQVGQRLRRQGMLAAAASVKIRFGDFETITRSTTLDRSTDLTDELWQAGRMLFDRWAAASFSPVRLIGFTAEQLSSPGTTHSQAELFPDAGRERRRRLDAALDTINDRFGQASVHRAASKPRRSRDTPPDDRVPEAE